MCPHIERMLKFGRAVSEHRIAMAAQLTDDRVEFIDKQMIAENGIENTLPYLSRLDEKAYATAVACDLLITKFFNFTGGE